MTFKIVTLGCKLNYCDSAGIEAALTAEGYYSADEGETPDILVVNSCAVTSMAVTKSRHALSRAKRDNPQCITVLCGCFPQSYPEEAALKSGADIIIGNANKSSLCDILREYLARPVRTVKVTPMSREFDERAAAPDEDRTRAFIKAQDGCDRYCTYCIIPKARGRVRSLPIASLEKQCADCVANGHKEIVLTGINLGCYGKDSGLSLGDAVTAAARSGVERLRLSSLEPELVTDELIETLKATPSLCPHFHLSLQSGSTAVLKRMARMYTAEQYREVVDKLRTAFPEGSFTTDIIVGFPEETDEEFAETVAFAREIGFAKIHVFPYSAREGTVAAEMKQLPPSVRSARVDMLTAVAKELELDFFRTQVGKVRTVLIEKRQSEDYSHGFTENYMPVRIPSENLPRHSLVRVIIAGFKEGYCIGRLLK